MVDMAAEALPTASRLTDSAVVVSIIGLLFITLAWAESVSKQRSGKAVELQDDLMNCTSSIAAAPVKKRSTTRAIIAFAEAIKCS